MSYTINNLYKNIVLTLQAKFPNVEARAMADRLLEFYSGFTTAKRVINSDNVVSEAEIQRIDQALSKLLSNTPMQYILGVAYFMDMELKVNPYVLIPRPETEELVSLIVKYQKSRQTGHSCNILDIGTGSGCIALALKKHVPGSIVTAIDISEDALNVAMENAKNNQAEINFIQADILDPSRWDVIPRFDLIVSNPPYVTNREKEQMQRNVLDHEPHSALFVPDDDPLVFYYSIMNFAKARLMKGGALWLEINEAFGQEVLSLFKDNMFKERELLKDMFGKNRFVKVIK